jgi:hypothetical protein
MRILVLAVVIAACAPTIDGPIDQQRARDGADAAALAAQLGRLPGTVRADVTLHRPVRDPLGASQPGSAAVVIVVDDRADTVVIDRNARALLHGTAPEITDPQIAIDVGATRPELASVGPITVEASSKPRLVGALALLLAVVAGLAGWIAWRERSR